jgi:hypothetical protein
MNKWILGILILLVLNGAFIAFLGVLIAEQFAQNVQGRQINQLLK